MANNVGDILSQLVKEATASGSSSGNPSTDYDYLKSIDDSLKSILKSGGMSQSNAKFQNGETDSSNIFRNRNSGLGNNRTFTGGFEKAMMDAFLGSDFKNKMKGVFDKLAKDAGVSVQDLPNALGKQLGQQLIGKFKGTKLGSDLFGKLDKFKGNLGDKVKSAYTSGRDNYLKTQSGQSVANSSDSSNPITGTLSEALKNKAMSNSSGLLTKLGTSVGGKTGGMIAKAGGLISGGAGSASAGAAAGAAGAGATAGAGGVLAGAGAAAGALGPLAIAAVAAMVAMEGLAPAIEGTKKLFASMNKAANRYQESRQKNLEYQIERMTADIEAMVKAPFDILEEAAQKIYDTWDSNLQLISGTQGYNKSDLQDLMGIFAQRLRDEGLTNILTGVDVTESLAKVLQSGLSGKAAEEFSYLATILNAAVPTQDFFGFGDTYASLAANMIKAGKTQDEAITYANEQMRSFASNVLFASRQLAGGFTTGLKDVQSLFDQSVQIAIASRTGDPSRIAGVLTSVAAITGAIAPDLASSMIDVIYKAAVGGNSTELVALRSLAGINASNTEFLRQLANDPQAIFSGLFTNLANMQNMSADAYMEVAEGLSSVFGISMDAFARIDFNYLSQAISSMNTNSNTLEENMKLLMSGQTTTTAEQLRAQQINQYMIEEGLAYVLDNEVARSIQENMWAEQRQRELLESTYAVELTGSALEFLEGLKSSVENILGFLNPIAWLGKAINLVATANETDQQRERVRQLLELGKVGTNQRALYQLMTPNVDLHLIEDIVTLMGGTPATSNGMLALGSALSSPFGTSDAILQANTNALLNSLSTGSLFSRNSSNQYKWGTLGKSVADILQGGTGGGPIASRLSTSTPSGTSMAQTQAAGNLQKMFATIGASTESGMTYSDWVGTSRQFGIADFNAALEGAGYTQNQVQAMFQSSAMGQGIENKARREEQEETFWTTVQEHTQQLVDTTAAMLTELTEVTNATWLTQIHETNLELIDLTKIGNEQLVNIFMANDKFFKTWVDFNITQYQKAYDATKVANIKIGKEKAKSDDAVLALAEALTKNNVDLLNPAVQTNVLLSEIVKILAMIAQQNNGGGVTLSNSLIGLATGQTQNKKN